MQSFFIAICAYCSIVKNAFHDNECLHCAASTCCATWLALLSLGPGLRPHWQPPPRHLFRARSASSPGTNALFFLGTLRQISLITEITGTHDHSMDFISHNNGLYFSLKLGAWAHALPCAQARLHECEDVYATTRASTANGCAHRALGLGRGHSRGRPVLSDCSSVWAVAGTLCWRVWACWLPAYNCCAVAHQVPGFT